MSQLEILANLNNALLGKITPNLRAVALTERNQLLQFYYNDQPSALESELANLAYQEMKLKTLSLKIIILPFPLIVPKNDFLVFLRYDGK